MNLFLITINFKSRYVKSVILDCFDIYLHTSCPSEFVNDTIFETRGFDSHSRHTVIVLCLGMLFLFYLTRQLPPPINLGAEG